MKSSEDIYILYLALESGNNLTNKTALNAIRLDHDISSLHFVWVVVVVS
jgi:hypothetical protein